MPKKSTTQVVKTTSTLKNVASMTGMMLVASAAIATILTWFVVQ